jgi:hypothetical protein
LSVLAKVLPRQSCLTNARTHTTWRSIPGLSLLPRVVLRSVCQHTGWLRSVC